MSLLNACHKGIYYAFSDILIDIKAGNDFYLQDN
jgi:hypothetical protein